MKFFACVISVMFSFVLGVFVEHTFCAIGHVQSYCPHVQVQKKTNACCCQEACPCEKCDCCRACPGQGGKGQCTCDVCDCCAKCPGR